MLRVIILAVALLIDPAITVGAGMSGCSQLSALSAATGVWASVAGRSPVYPATPSHPPSTRRGLPRSGDRMRGKIVRPVCARRNDLAVVSWMADTSSEHLR